MRAAVVALSAFLATVPSARAEIVDFVVDPLLTRWNVRGSYFPDVNVQGESNTNRPAAC